MKDNNDLGRSTEEQPVAAMGALQHSQSVPNRDRVKSATGLPSPYTDHNLLTLSWNGVCDL